MCDWSAPPISRRWPRRHMRGEPVDDAAILAEIAPAFVERDGGGRT